MIAEKPPLKADQLPEIIQGGMGVAVSDWRLAKAVAAEGGLGVVSGTAIGLVLARRLQDGDPDGSIRRGLSMFPDDEIAAEILGEYYLPNGRSEYQPYKNVPKFIDQPSSLAEKLNLTGAFVETKLAKEHGGKGLIGMNLLTKIQPQTPSAIHGAMLAGLDVLIMGAGVAINVPQTLDLISKGKTVDYRIYLDNENSEHYIKYDPNKYQKLKHQGLHRPLFLHIVSSSILASKLASYENGPDGFIIERHIAGGHNAPARSKKTDELGQPIYGAKDEANFEVLDNIGCPYWMAGGFGSPSGLRKAQKIGAKGIQVGSAFEVCNESGITQEIKDKIIKQALGKTAITVFTDPLASPSGYPFKVANIAGTLSDQKVYQSRKRICDLGLLSQPYETTAKNGELGWRCPAEPIEAYLRKGGALEKTLGRKCICNALSATVGGAQIRQYRDGLYVEPPIITAGDDINRVLRDLAHGENANYSASEVMDYLRSPNQ